MSVKSVKSLKSMTSEELHTSCSARHGWSMYDRINYIILKLF